MNWFNINFKKGLFIFLIIILPLISINTQQKPHDTGWFQQPFHWAASVVQEGFFALSNSVRNSTRLYLDLINIKKESSQLKAQNQELQSRLLEFEELSKENTRLHQMLSFQEKSKMELISARAMGKDLLPDHSTIRIDKGTDHGLKTGQAVITTQGVVGHIIRPTARSSHVLLINDRYSVIDGIVSRSRARGIVEGKSQGGCSLRHIEKSEDVQPGDIIVTSGLDNIFPKGFPVARVQTVENKPYMVSLRIDLEPIVDPKKIEEVFVIVNSANQDLTDQFAQRQQ